MRILVTGGAGFIGSHLVDRLVADAHCVHVVDNLATGVREQVHSDAHFHQLDVRDRSLRRLLVEEGIEYVFHEAAQTLVPASIENPVYDCDVNLMGLLNVLEGCREAGVQKILMPSSAAVYGDLTALPLCETQHGVPASFYGLTKLTSEYYLALYEKQFGLPYLCYRYSNVYGPRQGQGGEGGVVSIFCQRMREGAPLHIYGDGYQTRDFIYVGDVVEANIAGLLRRDAVGLCNVSTGQGRSVRELVEILSRLMEVQPHVVYEAERPGDIRDSLLATEYATQLLGWKATTSWEEGVAATVSYFQNRG